MCDIAVIGMGCRFPGGANDPNKFWDLLTSGTDGTSDVKDERWGKNLHYDENKLVPGKIYTIHGGFIDEIDKFDASFFGISPREANYMDPQQRILIEVVNEAMEDAGIPPESLKGKNVGVYVGAFTVDYEVLSYSSENIESIDVYTTTGTATTMLSNKISYLYDLKGPSMTIDTACSGSLVAAHLACEAIKNGECDIALVAGVNVMSTHLFTLGECKATLLSPDGRCKSFDESANGYARGEGAGVVLLKPLEKAVADGDEIYSVIKSTGVNQDGHTDGITVPNGEQQEILLRKTCQKANVSPSDITYMEAHGTGTAVGDPIEANAIGNVVREGRENKPDCIIGSVKSNIGHLEAAAGVASLIKVSLMMKNKKIPPNLHFNKPNPNIKFDKLRLKVNTELNEFKSSTGKLIAGINSFGFGGTNANLILENYENTKKERKFKKEEKSKLIVLTGKTQKALYDAAEKMRDYVSSNIDNDNISIENIAYSLLNKRSHYEFRLTFPVKDKDEMLEKLNAFISNQTRENMYMEKSQFQDKKNVVFVYTGMGPIWWAMGRQLLEKEEVFRKTVETCDEIIKEYAGWSIIDKLLADKENSELDQPQYAQPANFVVQVALTELWRSYGINPDAVVGHSVGETSASYVSGVLDLRQAIKVSIERSRAQQKTIDQGTMMAADLLVEEANEILKDYENKVSIGVVNSEKSVTLSGEKESLLEIEALLNSRGVFTKFLRVNVAYHSCQMDPIREEFEASIKGITTRKATTPIYSTVTGKKDSGDLYGEDYWWHNIRGTVLFKDAMDNLIDDGYNVFVEVGPHPVLRSSIQEALLNKKVEGKEIPSLLREKDEENTFCGSLGYMYGLGYEINKEKISPKDGNYIKIPSYAWQHQRYWNESEEFYDMRTGLNDHYMLGRKLKKPTPIWENSVTSARYPYLSDHKVQDSVLFPGAGYLELASAFLKEYLSDEKCKICNVNFKKAMFLKDNQNNHVQFIFNQQDNSFEIYSRNYESKYEWSLNATGSIDRVMKMNGIKKLNLDKIKEKCTEEIFKGDCYKEFSKKGFQYGSSFQSIEKLYRGNDSAISYIKVTDMDFINKEKYVLHPTIVDACFQSMISLMSNFDDDKLMLPTGLDAFEIYGDAKEEMISYVNITSSNEECIKADILLCDNFGNIISSISGFTISDSSASMKAENGSKEQTFYDFEWYNSSEVDELGYSAKKISTDKKIDFSEKGLWLVFNEEGELGTNLISELSRKGQECISIIPGSEYKVLDSERSIAINIDNDEDYSKLLSDVNEKYNLDVKGIIHLWNLKADYSADMEASYIESFQSIGCMSIIKLLRYCELKQMIAPLWVITRGVQPINGVVTEQALPQAPVWGVGKVFGYQEYPDMFGGLIDLDLIPSERDVELIIAQIQRDDTEDQVAFRGNDKFVPRVVKSEIARNRIANKFKPDKTYVITGAFGALGMLVARWMAKSGARRLILFSRTKFGDRKEWCSVDKNSVLGKRIEFVKELESYGAIVYLPYLDVSDKDALSKYVNDFYEEGWPEIAGVIHCAGIVKDKLISNMDKKSFEDVLKPKIAGAWNLHKTFEDRNLDFFVLFSSISSVINITMGQSNYAAANIFMDTLASYRKAKGLPCVSINWGPWANSGMASENNLVEYYENRGIGSISAYQGIQSLDRALNYDKAQAIVLTAKWGLVKDLFLMEYAPAMVDYLCENDKEKLSEDKSEEKNMLESLLEITDTNERKLTLREYLIDVIAKIFGASREDLNTTKAMSGLGMDSLMATDIRRNIELIFNVKVTMVELMKGISIDELSEKINERIFDGCGKSEEIHIDAEPENINEPFPLTDVQMAYYAGRNNDFVLGGVSPHIYIEMNINADITKFNEALNKVIEIHPMLRTVFLPDGNQKILQENIKYKISYEDISNYDDDIKNSMILDKRNQLSHKVFNPGEWPLFNISAFKLSDKRNYLFVGFDMLITDGIGWRRIGRELSKVYFHPDAVIEKPDFTFRDYMRGYKQIKNTKSYERAKKYWMDKLDTFPKAPSVEFKVLPKDVNKPHFRRLMTEFSKEEWDKLKGVARQHNVSLAVLFCTIYSMVLSYWSNQNRLAINATVFNKYKFNEQVDNIIGDFTSLMMLDIDLSEDKAFWDKVKDVQTIMTEALDHREFDGVEFIRELGKKRNIAFSDVSMPVVFTSMLPGDNIEVSGWEDFGKLTNSLSQTPQVYLDNQLFEIDGTLNIVLDYVEDVFYQDDIESMYDEYISIVKSILNEEKDIKVQLVQSDDEFIKNYNDTDNEINYTTLQELFVNQVAKTPENIAVKFNNETITYRELHVRSNCIAVYLKERGIKRNDNIAVLGKRCIETIVNILGILKAGAAYVPIAADCPDERQEYIIENSNAKLIITPELFDGVDLSLYEDMEVELSNNADDTAYIIYTSGSTGKPKGVSISHKAVVNTIIDINERFNVGEDDRIIGLSSMSFDLSVYDIFGTLSSGAELVILPSLRDIDSIVKIIKEERITIWNSVPAIMDMLINNMSQDNLEEVSFWQADINSDFEIEYNQNASLRLVMLSGDWIPLDLYEKILDKFTCAKVISLGGATEASIWSIYYEIEGIKKEWSSIPYGIPLKNQKIYILNDRLDFCPINVQGEICIGGIGVATEYVNDIEKTAKSFINHPTLGKIYRTGDFGVLRREGYVEFLGRRDGQVKIRGNRIELSEIEYQLRSIDKIKNAVVVDLIDKNNNKYLCAYLVSDGDLNIEEIKEKLSKSLAEYMIPLQYVKIDKIPLSANGKVDRKLLPIPGQLEIEGEFVSPKNKVEFELEQICKELLDYDQDISIDKNLYYLGWDSIKMISFISKIKSTFGVNLPFFVLMGNPTIKNIGQIISNMGISQQSSYTVFNEESSNKLFAFPPALTLGVAYKELSKLIDNYSIYSFDFIDDEKIIDKYVDEIIKIQDKGPYNLLGYSGGGSIAYEVAKRLEEKDYEVSNIILLDTNYALNTHVENMDLNLVEDFKNETINIVNKRLFNEDSLNKIGADLTNRIDRYLDMLKDKCSSDGKISSRLHYIVADKSVKDYRSRLRDNDYKWKEVTDDKFYEYQGHGSHNEMIFDENIKKNAQIVKSILKDYCAS